MRGEEPPRRLAELVDLQLERRPSPRITNTIQIDTFVSERMEDVVITNRSLFKTENQVDPQVYSLGYIIRF